jgi:hypothetical protein
MRRTPTPEDAKVLRFAGILGHPFVTVTTSPDGTRRVSMETNEPELGEEGYYLDPVVYQQIPTPRGREVRRWRRVL